jgi:hypothetical protein
MLTEQMHRNGTNTLPIIKLNNSKQETIKAIKASGRAYCMPYSGRDLVPTTESLVATPTPLGMSANVNFATWDIL